MTIHAICSFQDDNELGFVLGADSLVRSKADPSWRGWEDKGFVGPNYAGLWSGTPVFGVPTAEDWKDLLLIQDGTKQGSKMEIYNRAARRPLAGLFEGIQEGLSYAGDINFKEMDQHGLEYILAIAKRGISAIELYCITNLKGFAAHRATMIDAIPFFVPLRRSFHWLCGPGVPIDGSPYYPQPAEVAESFYSASELVKFVLTDPGMNELMAGEQVYTPGPPNLYVVSTKRIGRLN
jgi:hypothetical protein